jgi:hypothetical protein
MVGLMHPSLQPCWRPLSLLVLALAACAAPDYEELQQNSSGCGVERWSVKTGTDPQAASVSLAPVDSTIAALAALPGSANPPPNSRIAPTELTTFRLHATLVEFKAEGDGDVHLVLSDGNGHTLIAEIPKNACVGAGSPFAAAIAAAEKQFAAHYTTSGSFQTVNVPVVLSGVGFFDFQHGQTGVAPNAIELHPVLAICFGADCDGAPAADGGGAPDAGGSDAGLGADAGGAPDGGTLPDGGGADPCPPGQHFSFGLCVLNDPGHRSGGCSATSAVPFWALLLALARRRRR